MTPKSPQELLQAAETCANDAHNPYSEPNIRVARALAGFLYLALYLVRSESPSAQTRNTPEHPSA